MTADSVALFVRFGLVLLFLQFSALDKVLGFNHAVRQAQ
jgi:putative oxidoreductase